MILTTKTLKSCTCNPELASGSVKIPNMLTIDYMVTLNHLKNQTFRDNYDALQRSLRCCSFIEPSATQEFTKWENEASEGCNSKNKACKSCYPDSCYVKDIHRNGKCI